VLSRSSLMQGTVIFLHTRTYHRVGHNQSDEPRLMFNLRAQPASARPDLARFTIWRNQTWDHGSESSNGLPHRTDRLTLLPTGQKPWPNGLALDEEAQAGREPELVRNATLDAVTADDQ